MEPYFVDVTILDDDDPTNEAIILPESKEMEREDEMYQTMNSDLDKQIAKDMEAIKNYINKTDDSIRTRIEFFNNIDSSYINKLVDKSVSNHILCQQTAMGTITWHECTKCCFKTNNKEKLREHNDAQHPNTEHECKDCLIKFAKYMDLLRHMKVSHESCVFVCEKCTYMTLDQNDLRQHRVAEHLNLSISWYKCAQCAYRTGKKINLDRHVMYKHALF